MLGEEAPGRQNWPRIQGPIDHYGLEWGRVLEPLKQNFTVDPEVSSSESSEPFPSAFTPASGSSSFMISSNASRREESNCINIIR